MVEEETIQARRRRLASVPRACEACKLRKIRCDRSQPCSNCKACGITCQQTVSRIDRPPNGNKIAQLEEHILQLERRVLALETERGPEPTSRAHLRHQARCNAQPNQAIPNRTLGPGTKVTYEGESSFAEQAIQAHSVAGLIADTRGALQLDHYFSTLNMLLGQPLMPAVSPSGALPAMSSLPVELVTSIVKEIKKKAPIFVRSWVLDDVSLVQKLCQDLYFPTEPLSVGHLTSAYGILHAICKEFWLTKHSLCKSFDLGVQVATCARNFDAGLQTYEIVSQPSFLTILALTLGVIKAHSEAKSFVCSTLLSIAISHCQLLGYHREVTYRNISPVESNNMRRVFWTLYVFDQNISLLFGRPPKLHDSDIDTELPAIANSFSARPWDESFIAFINLARLHSQIYRGLYSIQASKQAHSIKIQLADSLSAALRQWRFDIDSIDARQADHAEIFELSKGHWKLIYLSTETLILRAPSTGDARAEISSKCLQVARECLYSNIKCFESYRNHGIISENEYANSFLLFTSFTPFVVTFIHVIKASNTEDLCLLEQTVGILQKMQDASPEVSRLYQICSAFLRLASDFMKPGVTQPASLDSPNNLILQPNEVSWQTLLQPDFLRELLGAELIGTQAGAMALGQEFDVPSNVI